MKKITAILALIIGVIFVVQTAQPVLATAAKPSTYDLEARAVYESRQDINVLLKMVNKGRDGRYESAVKRDYVDYLVEGVTGLGDYGRSIVFFVAYGTPSTQHLGYRERSGVLNSYKAAFNRLPLSKGDWTDVIRIANGMPPAAKSNQAEQNARKEFRKAFNREPILKSDAAAILIMAYGVRPVKKYPELEKAALSRFKVIYGFAPVYGYHWDVLRAMTYGNVK